MKLLKSSAVRDLNTNPTVEYFTVPEDFTFEKYLEVLKLKVNPEIITATIRNDRTMVITFKDIPNSTFELEVLKIKEF